MPFNFSKFIIIFVLFFSTQTAFAEMDESLYFTGTDIEVLTANKGRPEYPEIIPNIAGKYESNGFIPYTLNEFLANKAGFFMEKGENNSTLFLRGMQNSALILYDGVPLTNDLTKNFNIGDGELSLTGIEDIEVIRGASSTLWGPDAFGGIVNLKPKRGREVNGLKLGVDSSTNSDNRYWLNAGHNYGQFEYSLTGSYRDFGNYNYSDSYDANIAANVNISDTLKLNYLNIKSNRDFFYEHPANGYKWESTNNKEVNLIKAELSKKNNEFYIGINSYYYNIKADLKDMTRDWTQDVSVYSVDFRIDKSVFKRKGLLSLGLGYKENIISDSTVDSRGYPPDYVQSEDSIFKPLSESLSKSTRTKTIFAQYQHHFDRIDFLASLRKDDHSFYGNYLNYSTSLMYKIDLNSYAKFSLGTAYRTPYASFLADEDVDPEPEKIRSYNVEYGYRFSDKTIVKVVPFYNIVDNYINEDPYGGLSEYAKYKNAGFELIFNTSSKKVDLNFNLTYQNTWPNFEQYETLDYILIQPDGTKEYFYNNYDKRIGEGANLFGNLNIGYKLNKNTKVYSNIKYTGEREYQVLPSNKYYTFGDSFSIDGGIKFDNIMENGQVIFWVKDLLNSEEDSMGSVSSVQSEGRTFGLSANFKF